MNQYIKALKYLEDKLYPGAKILDIGSGGGLLCEPLNRLGADVTGIDASSNNIKVCLLYTSDAADE